VTKIVAAFAHTTGCVVSDLTPAERYNVPKIRCSEERCSMAPYNHGTVQPAQPWTIKNSALPEITACNRSAEISVHSRQQCSPREQITELQNAILSEFGSPRSSHGDRDPIVSRGVAQPGRAPGSGPGGRRFKSSLPDQSFVWFSDPPAASSAFSGLFVTYFVT
jgi:hypothetical protein